MSRDTRQDAPNYTTACIVMFGVNLAWVLFLVWAVWGLIVAILLGVAINHVMTRLQDRAMARARAFTPARMPPREGR